MLTGQLGLFMERVWKGKPRKMTTSGRKRRSMKKIERHLNLTWSGWSIANGWITYSLVHIHICKQFSTSSRQSSQKSSSSSSLPYFTCHDVIAFIVIPHDATETDHADQNWTEPETYKTCKNLENQQT
jgi:hypothetical protein